MSKLVDRFLFQSPAQWRQTYSKACSETLNPIEIIHCYVVLEHNIIAVLVTGRSVRF